MSFTFMICEIEDERFVCAVDEDTGKPYLNHRFSADEFISQFKDGVILQVTLLDEKTVKSELEEAKKLLELAKKKLRFPGIFNVCADEIEKFLNK